jgi:hypothetical protein
MKDKTFLCFVFCLLLLGLPLAQASDWTRVSDRDGLVLYERTGSANGLLAFRGEGTLQAPIRTVASVLLDRARLVDWVDHLEQVKRIQTLPNLEFVEYSYVGTPFVLKDRDFLSSVRVSLESPGTEGVKKLTITSRSVEDPSVPPGKPIRGEVRETRFELSCSKSAAGVTQFNAVIDVDPKGSVAHWVVNLFQRDWPRKSFRAIKQRTEGKTVAEPAEFDALLKQLDGC